MQTRTGVALLVAGIVGGGLISGAVIAVADIPDGAGVIHSCYSEKKGTWRPIDYPQQQCDAKETPLQWGETGPQGEPGTDGDNGTNGEDGSTVLNGAGAPADSLGNNGDFYLDTTNNKVYGPKVGGAWPASGVSLVGPPGDDGTFDGHFESSLGIYSLDVTDSGIVMTGPTGAVTINGGGVTVTGTVVTVNSSAQTVVNSGGLVRVGGTGCAPAARVGDLVTGGTVPVVGGPVVSAPIITGSTKVFVC